MFVVIALPDRRAGGAAMFVDAFGGGGFELNDPTIDATDRGCGPRGRVGVSSFCRGDACVAPTSCVGIITIIPCT